MGSNFLDSFFDLRADRFRRGAPGDAGGEHWRAVDQAMGCLACLRLARDGHRREEAQASARAAAASLLNDFGFGEYMRWRSGRSAPPRSHLGEYPGSRRRNSWHDSIVCFALLAATRQGLCPPAMLPRAAGLVAAVLEEYRPAGARSALLAHQAAGLPADGVHFTCTQCIWAAVGRAADELTRGATAADTRAHRTAWAAFHAAQASAEDGLLPVADVYPSVRLWCNSEPAAWLLLEPSDFGGKPWQS